MASAVWSLQQQWLFIVLLLLFTTAATSCYSSIFSFGDSLTDTGNLHFISQPQNPDCLLPPYGETHFHHPNGRCSDGRLIVDFIGITLFPSYPFFFFTLFFDKNSFYVNCNNVCHLKIINTDTLTSIII